jgi:creatinine amidohydrolase/Fe(II)-dependent formamide hydrolase-like protein
MPSQPAELMRPAEIIAARNAFSAAFVPVSPCFEWHSYHLPLATDALIAEGVCRGIVQRLGGVHFSPLSFGLDETRPEKQLLEWGFDRSDSVYGMRFPALPLCSEYCRPEEMRAAVRNRLEAIRGSGFRYAFLVNNHGGSGQVETLEELARETDGPEMRVWSVRTGQFLSFQHESLRTGGHAGKSETLLLAAFRPELVDLTQLPEGSLEVREMGILHGKPTIPAEHNPREVKLAIANEVRRSILDGFERFIREQCDL